ncbi:leucine-rich repeat extensin-like protein 5 [Lates japonicus]
MYSNKTSMEFIEGSRGIYRPIRVLFDTPIYERALQICWHMPSYKIHIALVAEFLRLQQEKQLSSAVTAEDMTELLMQESKSTLRVQLWEFELEDFDDDEVRPLLKLVWEVNNNMKMRDIEFEARRLLKLPETIPPQFQHPKIISQAHKYAKSLTEQLQEASISNLLGPREVVMEVVPKVLQGFWLPPPNTAFNMPSQQCSKMAVGVTKAVEDRVSTALSSMLLQVSFSRSIRDDVVLSIQETVGQVYTQDVLVKKLNCFAAELLNTISDVAAERICVLFQPQTFTKVTVCMNTDKDRTLPADVVDGVTTPAGGGLPGVEEDTEPEPDSAVTTPPPAPATITAEPPANTAIHNGLNNSLDEAEEQPVPSPEPDSAVVPVPPPIPLISLIPTDEAPAITAVQEGLTTSQTEPEQQPTPIPEPDSPPVPAPLTPHTEPPVTAEEPTEEPDSAVVSSPPPPVTPPAEPAPVLHGENICGVPTRHSAVVSVPPSRLTPPPVTTAKQADMTLSQDEAKTQSDVGIQGLFSWFRKTFCSCFLLDDAA